jgi:hypothetical protein
LRNKIYEFTFPTTFITVYPKWDNPRWYHDYEEPRGIMALLQTCHQIKDEALPFFLSSMTFNLQRCSIAGFLEAIGDEKVALVTSIIVMRSDIVSGYNNRIGGYIAAKLTALKLVHVLYEFEPPAAEKADWDRIVYEYFGRKVPS